MGEAAADPVAPVVYTHPFYHHMAAPVYAHHPAVYHHAPVYTHHVAPVVYAAANVCKNEGGTCPLCPWSCTRICYLCYGRCPHRCCCPCCCPSRRSSCQCRETRRRS